MSISLRFSKKKGSKELEILSLQLHRLSFNHLKLRSLPT